MKECAISLRFYLEGSIQLLSLHIYDRFWTGILTEVKPTGRYKYATCEIQYLYSYWHQVLKVLFKA